MAGRNGGRNGSKGKVGSGDGMVSTKQKEARKKRKQDGKRTKNPIPSAYFYFDGMRLSIWLDHPDIVWSGGNLTLVVIHVPSLNSIG